MRRVLGLLGAGVFVGTLLSSSAAAFTPDTVAVGQYTIAKGEVPFNPQDFAVIDFTIKEAADGTLAGTGALHVGGAGWHDTYKFDVTCAIPDGNTMAVGIVITDVLFIKDLIGLNLLFAIRDGPDVTSPFIGVTDASDCQGSLGERGFDNAGDMLDESFSIPVDHGFIWLASSAAAEPVVQPDMFVGVFEEVSQQTGAVVGTVNTEIRRPTAADPVPGKLDFYGPDTEFHAIYARSSFWYDPNHEGGSRVASAEGVGCGFFTSGAAAFCSDYVVMAIDVDDPAIPDQFAFAFQRDSNGEWIFTPERWFNVGKGSFVMHYTPPNGG